MATQTSAPTPAPAAPAAAPTASTRRRSGSNQDPGWLRTTQSLRGESLPRNDRVVDPLLWKWVRRIAIWGGVGLLVWIAYAGFIAGQWFSPVETRVTIERVVERPAPAPIPVPTVQPTALRQLTPEERAEQYKEERRRQYGIR